MNRRDIDEIVDIDADPLDHLTQMVSLSVRYILDRPDESSTITSQLTGRLLDGLREPPQVA